MLQVLVGYTKDLAIDIRWLVIDGDAEFFRITKRLHNRIHGQPGDGGPSGRRSSRHVGEVMAANADSVGDQVSAGDLVLLHDPQTAGLVGPLARRGAHVVWRSHIGIDGENDLSRSAWDVPPATARRRRRLRLHPQHLRAAFDPAVACVDHPTLDRSLLAEEPADGPTAVQRRARPPSDSSPAHAAAASAGTPAATARR